MTRLGPWVPLVLALAVSVVLVVAPRVAPPSGLFAAIGPLAWAWIWVPTTLGAVAALLDATGSRAGLVRAVRAGARASVWLLLGLIVLDPAPNLPDHVAVAIGGGWRSLIGQLRPVLVGIVGLLVLGAIAGSLLGGGEAPPPSNRKTVTTGSSVGPVTALVLRGSLRLTLWGIRTTLDLVWIAVAWTIDGLDGIRALRRPDDVPSDAVALVARGRDLTRRATGWTGAAVGRASAGWGRRSEHGVWLLPAALERDVEGEVTVTDWPDRGLAPEDAALRELGLGLLAAYDVAISSGSGGGRGRGAPDADGSEPGGMRQRTASRPAPHRVEVARAWTRPGLLCLVLRATPASAATAMAKVGLEVLLPSLDATTGWTLEDLRGLRLSDRRVADDELRGGEAGLFIALETAESNPAIEADGADATQAAIGRAMREAGLAGIYSHRSTDDAWDATTVEYEARVRDAHDWKRLEEAWRGLAGPVAVYLRTPGVRMEARLETHRFMCVVPRPAAEFPGPEITDWDATITAHPPTRRHRMRVVIGYDQRGDPVRIALGSEAPAPHFLLAGGTGSGKSSVLKAWLASLCEANRADDLRISVIDSPKRELARALDGAPHLESVTIAEDGDAVLGALQAFVDTMDERYRRYEGRPIDPDKEPTLLLVIEEWATLVELLDRRTMESVLRLTARLGAIGRSALCHLILVSQRGGVDVVPARLRVHLAGRIVGYLPTVSEWQAAMGVSRRVLPNVRGRMAISVDGSEITIAQAVHLPPERLAQKIGEWRERARGRADRPGTLLDGLELPEDESVAPKAPRAAEVLALDLLTTTRLLLAWQAEQSGPLVVSVRGLIGRVRELGYPTGRVESYTAALARLEQLGVLEPVADHPTAARRLAMDWATARAAVTAALEPGRDRHDPVYPELYP